MRKEAQEEIQNLELSYVELRLAYGKLEAVGVFFKTENATYLFRIGKCLTDGKVDEDYTSFGLNEVERKGNFYRIDNEEYLHDAIKKVVIQIIEKTNFQFLTPEKIQEFNEELEIFKAEKEKEE